MIDVSPSFGIKRLYKTPTTENEDPAVPLISYLGKITSTIFCTEVSIVVFDWLSGLEIMFLSLSHLHFCGFFFLIQ